MIEISQATRWSITVDALLAAHRRTPLKGVLVASPANPTGTMMRPEALSELIAAAEREGIRFISDEIYHRLDYAFPAETAAKFSDNAVIINSFSKYFCMTGWRVAGWWCRRRCCGPWNGCSRTSRSRCRRSRRLQRRPPSTGATRWRR